MQTKLAITGISTTDLGDVYIGKVLIQTADGVRPPISDDVLNAMKLSDLLAVGLWDVAAVERDDRYQVDMDNWHLHVGGACHVCLAGSVLARHFDPEESAYHLAFWIDALDRLRRGDIDSAVYCLTRADSPIGNRDIPDYDGPSGEWWPAMLKLHDELVAADL